MKCTHWLSIVLIGACLVGPVVASKAPPPRRQPSPAELGPDVGRFARAYERANEPVMLVLVGLVDPGVAGVNRVEQTATGSPQGNRVEPRYAGARIKLFDPTGDTTKLRSDIEQILLRNPDVELVSPDALAEADRREVRLLQLRDEREAIRLLATKVNAELTLIVRMLDTPQVRARGANYRVDVELLDVVRGRKIGGFGRDHF